MAGVDERDTTRDSDDGTDSWEEDEQTSDESSVEYQPDTHDESDRRKYLNEPFSLCQTQPGPVTVNKSDEELLYCVSDTNLNHNSKLAYQQVYLICVINGEAEPIKIQNIKQNDFTNTRGRHAEDILIHTLKTRHKEANEITVYISCSPCSECAMSLKQFLEENEAIKLTLYVAHLYKIQRASCIKKGCVHGIDGTFSCQNYCGLRYLMSLGSGRCKIEAFDTEVWMELISVLRLSETQRDEFSDKYSMKHRIKHRTCRSRKREDILTKKDLNFIKTYSPTKYDETSSSCSE